MDIDCRHIVENNSDTSAFPIIEDMVCEVVFPAPRKPDKTVTGSNA